MFKRTTVPPVEDRRGDRDGVLLEVELDNVLVAREPRAAVHIVSVRHVNIVIGRSFFTVMHNVGYDDVLTAVGLLRHHDAVSADVLVGRREVPAARRIGPRHNHIILVVGGTSSPRDTRKYS